MTHAGPKDPLVATIHNMTKKLGRVLPHTSAIFHAYASADTPWVAQTLSHYTSMKRGKVSSNSSTHEATQFGDSICHVCISTFQLLVHSDPTDAGLNWHRWGLPPWSSEYQIRSLPFLPIHYSLSPPNCPPRSHFKPFYHLFQLSTFLSWTRVSKSSKSREWSLPLDFYRSSIH
jgi:hypothetical protein